MSLASLIEEAGVSLDNTPPAVPVEQTAVSPTVQPSAAIPVDGVVVSTEEPMVPATAVVEQEIAQADAEIVAAQAQGSQLEAEQAVIREKADELLEIQTSLESLDKVIRKTGANGISNQTAQAVQLHLKDISRRLGIETAIVSVENFNARDPREQHSQARIALESIRTSAKTAKNKFLAAIERIIDLFKKIAMNYLDGVHSLESKVDKLETRLRNLKKTGVTKEISLTSAGLLLFEDSIDIPADIPGLAHFAAQAYPEAVIRFLEATTKDVLRFDPEHGLEALDELLDKHVEPLKFLIDQKIADDELPGGYTLDVSQDGMSVGLKGGTKSAAGEHKVDVLSTVDLRRKVREIKETVLQIKEIRPEVDKIDKAGRKLIEAVKRATSKKGDEENEEVYEHMASRVGRRVAAANPRIGEIISYLVRYLNAQTAVCTAMASAIESGKDDDKAE